MAYRDDREALWTQVRQLEQDNERLRDKLDDAGDRYERLQNEQHDTRQAGTRSSCALCGGLLLPVAVFAGHDTRAPLPLSISTMRFGLPDGGFTHSAPVHSLACSSCGYIHSFLDIEHAARTDGEPPPQPAAVPEPAPDAAEEPAMGDEDDRADEGTG